MNTRELMELASAAPLPKPKESRELIDLRQAWAWALPSVKREIRARGSLYVTGWKLKPETKEVLRQCRRLLEIVEK